MFFFTNLEIFGRFYYCVMIKDELKFKTVTGRVYWGGKRGGVGSVSQGCREIRPREGEIKSQMNPMISRLDLPVR